MLRSHADRFVASTKATSVMLLRLLCCRTAHWHEKRHKEGKRGVMNAIRAYKGRTGDRKETRAVAFTAPRRFRYTKTYIHILHQLPLAVLCQHMHVRSVHNQVFHGSFEI
jgi:hypothetical protein